MFNFVALDCFRPVLQHGVVVSAGAVLEYLRDQGMSLSGCACFWNGEAVDQARLGDILADVDGEIELKVRTKEG